MEHTIELDCPPGYPRPGDIIGRVIAGTELENLESLKPDATISRFFGNWIWKYDVSEEIYEKVSPILFERITKLYKKGTIRWGSC